MHLSCPECDTVLKPAKPLPAGKKVKCPKCGTTFTVGDDAADTAPPPKVKAAPAPTALKKKPEKKPDKPPAEEPGEDEEGGTYGIAGGDEKKEDEEEGPAISYAPDTSIKDLRGPAQAAIIKPTNQMLLCGAIGFLGWLALLIILLVPVLFPIEPDEGDKDTPKPVLQFGKGLGSFGDDYFGPPPQKPENKDKENVSLYMFMGRDLAKLALFPWYMIIFLLLPILLGMCYSAVQTFGTVRAQNLESRPWGIAASIMAMIPANMGGTVMVVCMLISFLMNMVVDDPDTIAYMIYFIGGILFLLQIGAGVYLLVTLMNEDVIAGFAFVPDTEDVKAKKKDKPRRKKQR